MNLKPTTTYYLKNSVRVLKWYYIVFLGMTLLVMGISAIAPGNGSLSNNGMEMITAIVILILGLCSFKDEFHFFLQNGISRRTAFLSYILSLVILCAVTAAVEMAVCTIMKGASSLFSNVGVKSSIESFFETIYSERTVFTGAAAGVIVRYFWTFGLFVLAGTLGYLITNLFYLLSKWGKIIFCVGAFALVNVVYPIVDVYWLDGAISRGIAKFLHFVSGIDHGLSPLYFVGTAIVGSAVIAAGTWLMTRRAKPKKE